MDITLQELSDYNESMKKEGFIPTIDLFLEDVAAEPTNEQPVIYPEEFSFKNVSTILGHATKAMYGINPYENHDHKETCTCNV